MGKLVGYIAIKKLMINFHYDCSTFGARTLQEISLKGVAEAYSKNSEGTESKGVKAHFKMDESGILFLDNVGAYLVLQNRD